MLNLDTHILHYALLGELRAAEVPRAGGSPRLCFGNSESSTASTVLPSP